MGIRTTNSDTGHRAMGMASRATLGKCDDDHLWQQGAKLDVCKGESHTDVERCQSYGFTAVPLDQDKQEGTGAGGSGGAGGSSGSSAGGQQQGQGESAEAIVLYLNGSRSHPVIIGVDDRRHRPYKIPAGGSMQYDQHGNATYVHPDKGTFMLALDGDQSGQQSGGGAGGGSGGAGGEQKERMVSMRHVEKKKQPRKKGGEGGAAGGAGGGGTSGGSGMSGSGGQEYKHEGETVNTEIRCTKKKISFFSGEDEVGYYDKEKKEWMFKGKIRLGDKDASKNVVGRGLKLADQDEKEVFVYVKTPDDPHGSSQHGGS
jgi:hypothetical protein